MTYKRGTKQSKKTMERNFMTQKWDVYRKERKTKKLRYT